MFTETRKLINRAALVLAATAMLAACDDDGTGPDDHDHDEAAGLVILDQNNATVVSVNASRQVTGSLSVKAGQAKHLEVWFVAEDGDRFQPDGAEHTLDWTVANESIAVIDSHGDHMDLDGVAAGSTAVVFSILHGNHSDYDSPSIPITVTP
ncbi:hypothetical protein [Longimicrobium terrae]|uniref:BIG2 domain-containing protein n=1 Tax=Longimicrobium terrae TaxID=1639882 RepID=A0A841H104_9BACT|nr:hypothetical protein [Longimicrobium terrae]MBB4637140.1 hypothetical protein [Longimicrobium terrae]MBB6071599.1 hypothetical protein [Longimicrobium terrae]NNC29982.1 hypothetical protein [Longimicrobium terrae]